MSKEQENNPENKEPEIIQDPVLAKNDKEAKIDLKEEKQEISPNKPSVSEDKAVNPEEVDAITKEVQSLVIGKQLDIIKGAILSEELDEKERERIAKLSYKEFAQYLTDNKEKTDKAINGDKVQKELNDAEVEGYKLLHDKLKYTDVQWEQGTDPQIRTKEFKNKNGEVLCNITEKNVKDPFVVTTVDGKEQKVEGYRTIDFPIELESKKGPLHLSMAVKDTEGKNIEESKAVYFTAHYDKSGKLTEVSAPIPVKFNGKGEDAIGYIEKEGKIYTLPVTQGKYKQMMKEVEKNQDINRDLSQTVEMRATDLAMEQEVNNSKQKDKKDIPEENIDIKSELEKLEKTENRVLQVVTKQSIKDKENEIEKKENKLDNVEKLQKNDQTTQTIEEKVQAIEKDKIEKQEPKPKIVDDKDNIDKKLKEELDFKAEQERLAIQSDFADQRDHKGDYAPNNVAEKINNNTKHKHVASNPEKSNNNDNSTQSYEQELANIRKNLTPVAKTGHTMSKEHKEQLTEAGLTGLSSGKEARKELEKNGKTTDTAAIKPDPTPNVSRGNGPQKNER